MYLLMVTLLTSSPSFANIDSYLKDLDLEDTRVVLRALNTKFKVDWVSEFSNHPKCREKTQKILNFLIFILDERIKKINRLHLKRSQVLNNSGSNTFLREWCVKRTSVCEEIKARLRGNCEDSEGHAIYVYEHLSLRPLPSALEAPPSEDISDSAINVDPIVSDFVIIDEDLIGHEISIKADFPSVCPLSEFISLPLAGSSSTAEYPPEIVPPPSLYSSSAPSDVDEDPESLHLRNESENWEELFLALDERDAKITLQAMLKNNYLIPRGENGYERIRAYLSWVLLKKSEKALLKKINLTSSDAERSKFKSDWYDIKCAYYEASMNRMWDPL